MNEFIEWVKRLLANEEELQTKLEEARRSVEAEGNTLVDVKHFMGQAVLFEYRTGRVLRKYDTINALYKDDTVPDTWVMVEKADEQGYENHEWFRERAPKGLPPSLFNIDDVDFDDVREWLDSVS